MKNIYSLIACLLVCVTLFVHRATYPQTQNKSTLQITTWDALGYYMYLPAAFIYNDITELKWFSGVDAKYKLSGGQVYQAHLGNNGKYVLGYLSGIAILETPFFFIGHLFAQNMGYPTDGFSLPYQYSIAFAALFYAVLSVFLLRRLLLYWFNDIVVTWSILLLTLATNFIQYAAVDSGMSHVYIFPLYILIVFTTIRWHRKPAWQWAALSGYIIGFATICRPTEAIMLFIPLFWNTHTKEERAKKWQLVKQHKIHVIIAATAGVIGVLPQLAYWKFASGSFIYDVGSKWDFLNPHFRVLFGWEKGWFIYTPITVFFIIGMFFMKNYPFRNSVLLFCLLNIYIIISWSIWRYGASYSVRALVQSYPLFALPLAVFIQYVQHKKWRFLFYILATYLIVVNLFQVGQYNKTILHYDDMNRKYYGSIYLNPSPSALDMSLLDNEEFIGDEGRYNKTILVSIDTSLQVICTPGESKEILNISLNQAFQSKGEQWLRVDCIIEASEYWETYSNARIVVGDSVKQTKIRLQNGITKMGKPNLYAFYMRVPSSYRNRNLSLFLNSGIQFTSIIRHITITKLERR